MKQIVNKKYFFGLFLLSVFLMVWIVSVTNWQTVIEMNNSGIKEHIVRLHSLFLWNSNVNDTVSMKINTWENFLSISGWLAVWSNHSVGPDAVYSAIGWWSGNSLYGEGNWIVWWAGNSVDGKYSLIGWWEGNSIDAENSVILWGQGNKANWRNSLVLWQKAEWNTWSFAWSAKVSNPNSARIDTKSGVLIWTYTPIDWVKLVISWAVSLTDAYSTGLWIWWEIKVVNGCIYAYDGEIWQVMWKSSRQSDHCGGEIQACQFWETLLYPWDTVYAYKNFWSSNSCSSIKVMCSGWNLVDASGNTWTYYPYCYEISWNNWWNGWWSNWWNGWWNNWGGDWWNNWEDNSKCDINRDWSVTIADKLSF